jgi:hypothetical protein
LCYLRKHISVDIRTILNWIKVNMNTLVVEFQFISVDLCSTSNISILVIAKSFYQHFWTVRLISMALRIPCWTPLIYSFFSYSTSISYWLKCRNTNSLTDFFVIIHHYTVNLSSLYQNLSGINATTGVI